MQCFDDAQRADIARRTHGVCFVIACPKGTYKSMVGPASCVTCTHGSVTYYDAAPRCECQSGFSLADDGNCQRK